ncbi:hypothetical protein MT418_006041 [Batrachochytrium dendrobatidis]
MASRLFFRSTAQLTGRRFASTDASTVASKAKPVVSSFATRLQGLMDPVIYYGRVGLEFASQVAKHQRVTSFPNVGVAQEGIAKFFQAFYNGEWKKVTLSQVTSFALDGVKIYGFFLVGEMVGRGSVIGYNIEGGSHGAHH